MGDNGQIGIHALGGLLVEFDIELGLLVFVFHDDLILVQRYDSCQPGLSLAGTENSETSHKKILPIFGGHSVETRS